MPEELKIFFIYLFFVWDRDDHMIQVISAFLVRVQVQAISWYFVSAAMVAEHPTASWQAMQDGSVFYRKTQLYNIQDKLPKLDEYVVAGCRFGGPIGAPTPSMRSRSFFSENSLIAMMRDTTKVIALGRSAPPFAKNEIRVYSSAGEGLLLFTVSILGLTLQ